MSKEREIPPKGVKENFYYLFTKGSEFSKKLDIIVFGIGGVIFFINPGVGVAIIAGNAVTYAAADQVEKTARGRLDNLQAKRLGNKNSPQIINFRQNQQTAAA